MKAIIIAAGKSTRLYPLTLDKPKSLLELGPSTIIEFIITQLKGEGVENIVVVTGYLAEQFGYLEKKEGVKLILNPFYDFKNNLYSFWCAKDELLEDSSVCIYADLVMHPSILKKLITSSDDIVLAVDRCTDEETMQVKIKNERLMEVRKAIPAVESSGTFIGAVKFSPTGARSFVKELERAVKNDEDGYFTIVIEELVRKGMAVNCVYTGEYPWTEVDTLNDLENLKDNIYPKIQGRHGGKEAKF